MVFFNEFISLLSLLTQILDDFEYFAEKTSRDREVNTCPSLCDLKHGWKTFGAILFAGQASLSFTTGTSEIS